MNTYAVTYFRQFCNYVIDSWLLCGISPYISRINHYGAGSNYRHCRYRYTTAGYPCSHPLPHVDWLSSDTKQYLMFCERVLVCVVPVIWYIYILILYHIYTHTHKTNIYVIYICIHKACYTLSPGEISISPAKSPQLDKHYSLKDCVSLAEYSVR